MINPLHTSINLSPYRKRVIAEKTVEWCKANLGTKRSKLTLKVRKANAVALKENEVGHFKYWNNEMVLNHDVCKSVKMILTTIIHEYTHYLQPMRQKYVELYEKHGYWKHPFEIEARSNEKLWVKCYEEVVKPYLIKSGLWSITRDLCPPHRTDQDFHNLDDLVSYNQSVSPKSRIWQM